MKKIMTALVFVLTTNLFFAQENWFKTYSDSLALMRDANLITNQFKADLKKIKPNSKLNAEPILHTTPNLIYIERDTVHLSYWDQVIPQFKQYLAQLAGSEEKGKEVFGLFFNGFYLPHELGHGFQFTVEKRTDLKSYEMEYFANTVSMLWWKKHHREADLKKCYDYAKIMMKDYPYPFPEGVNYKTYFSENYNKIQRNMELFARVYPYVQFNQFIEIYEDQSLPDFDTFIKNYLAKNKKAK